jgi:UDP-2,3-diacylglucosamine pyrophosphatase LpxH
MEYKEHTLQTNIFHTYLFLNDLHLAAGFNAVEGRPSQGESFFYDAVFARFLGFHISQAASNGDCLHLVLLGDVFDFLRIESLAVPQHRYSLDSSPATAIEKLRRIAAGHPEFFRALGRLLDAGGFLELLPGNHDIELIRQPVQSIFKELLVDGCQNPIQEQQIRFHPWMLYVPGVLYAEHGQQHHFINTFPYLLHLHIDQPPGRFRLPLGSHFELYLSSLGRLAAPYLSGQSAAPRALLRTLLRHPGLWLRTSGSHLRFAAALLHDLLRRPLVKSGRIAGEQARRIQVLARESGLSVQLLSELERLTRYSTQEMIRRVLRLRRPAASAPTGGYLFQSASTIHQLLRSTGQAVPFYIFGHTHQSAHLPLPSQGEPAFYLNAGSWIGMDAPGGAAPTAAGVFQCVRQTAHTPAIAWITSQAAAMPASP